MKRNKKYFDEAWPRHIFMTPCALDNSTEKQFQLIYDSVTGSCTCLYF